MSETTPERARCAHDPTEFIHCLPTPALTCRAFNMRRLCPYYAREGDTLYCWPHRVLHDRSTHLSEELLQWASDSVHSLALGFIYEGLQPGDIMRPGWWPSRFN